MGRKKIKREKLKKENNDLIYQYQETKNATILKKIIKQNFKLIPYCIKKFNLSNPNIELDDVKQEGYLGLLKAIQNFDITKKIQFSTFAVYYIKFYIQNYIKVNSNGSIAIGNHGMNLLNKYRKDKKKIKKQLQSNFKIIAKTPIFLDAPIDTDEGTVSMSEVIADDTNHFDNIDFKVVWEKITLDLSKKEKDIISYYIQGYRWVDIAKNYNSSPNSIRANAVRAFNRIKKHYGEKQLRDLLCL